MTDRDKQLDAVLLWWNDQTEFWYLYSAGTVEECRGARDRAISGSERSEFRLFKLGDEVG